MNNIVSFELAKLLKEKGFGIDEKYQNYYIKESYYNEEGDYWIKCDEQSGSLSLFDGKYSAPTVAEVVMWLYEKHGIWVVAFPELFNGEIVTFYPSIFEQGVGEDIEQYYNSPTEAYAAAIYFTLNNLI